VPVDEDTDIVKIGGYVVKPEFAKKTRGEQFFFVNNRFIKSAYLNHAVSAAFEGLLPDRARPSYFLYLDVDPGSIDINIHPTKTEIKFDDEHALYAMLRSTVKHSLGQFNIAPVLDFNRDESLDTPYDYKDKFAAIPQIQVDRTFNPFENIAPPKKGAQRAEYEKPTTDGWEQLYEGLRKDPGQGEADSTTYQLQNKYIVTTIKSGMIVIHQHRAHQRVLYEELLKNITLASSVSQQLLFPLVLSFSPSELAIFLQLKEGLENTGFVFGGVKDEALEITGIPTAVTEAEVPIIIEQLLSDLENEVPDVGFSQTDALAKSMAKSMAVKSGEPLEASSREHLVNSLFACKEPTVSPSNKTTFISITSDELERKFQ